MGQELPLPKHPSTTHPAMIHPINIPEDLFASNPERPQFFKPRPKLKVSYGPDGRRLGPDGNALEPLSPNTSWHNVFMRAFIRRLVPPTINDDNNGSGGSAADESDAAEGDSLARKASHVDIVDLSPSPSSATEEAPKFDRQQSSSKQQEVNENEEEEERKSGTDSESMPDRPSSDWTGEEEEEAATADQLTLMGSGAMLLQPDQAPLLTRQISRQALSSILRPCCVRKGMEEFARLDFSQLNKMFNSEEVEEGELKLIPGNRGSRVWTKQHRAEEDGDNEEEEQKEDKAANRRRLYIRFHIASVQFSRAAKKVSIRMEAHNALAKQLPFTVETHLHRVRGEQIGECVQLLTQMEWLEPEKETTLCVEIPLDDGQMQKLLEEQEDDEEFLMVTIHGQMLTATTC